MLTIRNLSLSVILLTLVANNSLAKEYKLFSPDKSIEVSVKVNKGIVWSAKLNGAIVVDESPIDIVLKNGVRASQGKVRSAKQKEVKNTIKPEVPYKFSEILDHYNELALTLNNGLSLEFRAYNNGLAYAFGTSSKSTLQVEDEPLNLQFPQGTSSWFPKEQSMYSHNENSYPRIPITSIDEVDFCSLPVMFELSNGSKVVFTETALSHYPNMFLRKDSGKQGFVSQFPKYVLEAIPNSNRSPDRNQVITLEADYIAVVESPRKFPWRVFLIASNDSEILTNTLAYQLGEPSEIKNPQWIKPGKVAWDWYNANNIYGVDFKSGLNTQTYKYFIDFASDNGIEYVILDEGWTKSTTEILDFNPEMDVKWLINYAKSKNVGIILWVLWKPLDENTEEILQIYQSWGAKGIKVDFMQRSDQAMVNSYEKIAAISANLELLVNFHGSFKPAGLQRKYPNVVNFEGVKGGEHNKWSDHLTPDHNLTIPFIRMAAGPMDYTPGSMINTTKGNFAISYDRPMSQGTRCHQLAMFILYDAPLQMMCESPSTYIREQECTDFIAQIPTTWDETRVFKAKISDYVVIARRKGNDWFIAAMTDWTPRSFELPLSFLKGTFEATIMSDGINADRYAPDYKKTAKTLTPNDTITIDMKPGGGYAAILRAK